MIGRGLSTIDRTIGRFDRLLRKAGRQAQHAIRPSPASEHCEAALSERQRRHAAGLMRVNHTGEVCAQALYEGQALLARRDDTRKSLLHAAQEEIDHLHWCEQRLTELDARSRAG